MVRQLAQPGAGDHDEGNGPKVRDEVEREADDKFDDLDEAPGLVFGAAGRLAKHADRVGGFEEEDALRGDEVDEAVVDQGGLGVGCLAHLFQSADVR